MVCNKANKLIYTNDGETVQIEAWGDNALRVRATMNPTFTQHDWALDVKDAADGEVTLTQTEPNPDLPAYLEQLTTSGEICNGTIKASIDPNGVISFMNNKGKTLLKEYARRLVDESSMALAIPSREYRLPQGNLYQTRVHFYANKDERIYGMGQYQQHELNLKGCLLELAQRNSQVSVPFYVSSLGYGFLWNNPAIGSVAFAINGTEWYAQATSQIDYLIIAGDTPADIVEGYMRLTGLPPMMPEYGLGFWQSKLRYVTQDELLAAAHRYKELGIPLDVIVCDFFHWTNQGDFRFDPECWPDPVAMCSELHKMGIRLMVSVWPAISKGSINYREMLSKGYLVRCNGGVRQTMEDSVVFFDATNPEARAFVWSKIKENYWDKGAQLFWLDVAEPEYQPYDFENYSYFLGSDLEVGNAYPKLYLQGFYDGITDCGEEQTVSLLRSAWAGSARYGALVWSGDIVSSFECFHRQVVAGLNMAMAGIPWWTTDIGGFHGGTGDNPQFRELFARWFAYGCFCPVMRLHGNRSPWRFIDGHMGSGADNEIWSFGDENFELCRKYIALRERLRGYIREQMKLAHTNGTPIMRPLLYDFSSDAHAWQMDDTYMFGGDLLVAPVTEEGLRTREVYLPQGVRWVDVWSKKVYDGGQTITVDAPLSIIPVLCREGAQVLEQFV